VDLSTITIDRNEARKAVAQYRRAMQTSRTERARDEDAAIMRGYREIAAGHPIISLRDAIHAGGENSRFLPKIAIARADEPRISVRRERDGSLIFGRNIRQGWRTRREMLGRGLVALPADTLSNRPWAREQPSFPVEGHAIVPIVPPQYRPNASLDRYWILFEAKWDVIPPKDPALLRSLGGGLYAVLATWDLTELERTVLGMTRARP
jgi:hypothetical protein